LFQGTVRNRHRRPKRKRIKGSEAAEVTGLYIPTFEARNGGGQVEPGIRAEYMAEAGLKAIKIPPLAGRDGT
jgi:hypothetical protein